MAHNDWNVSMAYRRRLNAEPLATVGAQGGGGTRACCAWTRDDGMAQRDAQDGRHASPTSEMRSLSSRSEECEES